MFGEAASLLKYRTKRTGYSVLCYIAWRSDIVSEPHIAHCLGLYGLRGMSGHSVRLPHFLIRIIEIHQADLTV